mgnify:CR=1 FL=1
MNKILVVRTDRLGDVLMCLPTLNFLRTALPESTIHWHFAEDFVQTLNPFLESRKIQYKATQFWPELFRKEKYSALLMLLGEGEIARAAFWARVPVRLGQYSRPLSFVLFNAGIRQKRSQSEKSEGEYNLDLAKELCRRLTGQVPLTKLEPVCLPVDAAAQHGAESVLRSLDIEPNTRFVILHPGMAGSALNLSTEQYAAVAKEILRTEKLVLSVGPNETDQEMAAILKNQFPNLPTIERQPLHVLKEIFRSAAMVIAPSTGPIHLAHYVGTPTVGIYSPVRSHHPKRWAPWGGNAPTQVVFPDVECPGKTDCVGSSCKEFYCMENLAWSSLILKATNGLKA